MYYKGMKLIKLFYDALLSILILCSSLFCIIKIIQDYTNNNITNKTLLFAIFLIGISILSKMDFEFSKIKEKLDKPK